MNRPITQIPIIRSGAKRLLIASTARDFPRLVELAYFLPEHSHGR